MADPEVNVTAKPPVDCTGLTPKIFLLRDEALDICCCHRNVEHASFLSLSSDSPCSHFCKDNGTCGCFKGFQLKNDGVTCEGKQNIFKSCL